MKCLKSIVCANKSKNWDEVISKRTVIRTEMICRIDKKAFQVSLVKMLIWTVGQHKEG